MDMVSSITSAISSALLESLKSAGIIPQEPVQTSDPAAAAVQGSVAQVVQDLTVHWELWLQAHHMTKLSSSNNPPNSFNRQSKQPFPRGFCWKFHQGERCFGCNFKHTCFKCGGDHPATKCKSGKPTAVTSRTVASSLTTNTNQSK
ncbi:unnamed protein product [Porites evermanni]|uniref:C3H1-type domain-containing protein n=1 Tax=Porites evermanni TaxID=104178 RepID=A0ABN8MK36_9CNID|nr:unnamed protein product [Porites evermanni]